MRLSAHPARLPLLRAHIEALCDRHRLEIRTLGRRPALAASSNHVTRSIRIRPITSRHTYAIALHEIGHLVIGPWRGTLADEAAAWAWARDHALLWTPSMDTLLATSLATHAAA